MLVFIDESGDPGFRVDKGASPVFVLAMVVFETHEAAAETTAAIATLRATQGFTSEFKFNKTREALRDAYFTAVRGQPFMVRAMVVDKSRIRSPHLKTDKERFYNFFLGHMLRFDNGRLRAAKIVIDGSGDREFRAELKSYLDRRLREGAIAKVRFGDSHRDELIQLADMSAGAIARSYRSDRPNPGRWREMLQRRIEDVWNFR